MLVINIGHLGHSFQIAVNPINAKDRSMLFLAMVGSVQIYIKPLTSLDCLQALLIQAFKKHGVVLTTNFNCFCLANGLAKEVPTSIMKKVLETAGIQQVVVQLVASIFPQLSSDDSSTSAL